MINFDFKGNKIIDPVTTNQTDNQGPDSNYKSDIIVSYDLFEDMFVPAKGVHII